MVQEAVLEEGQVGVCSVCAYNILTHPVCDENDCTMCKRYLSIV